MAEAFGLPLPDLPDDWRPAEVVVIVKAFDGDLRPRLAVRYSEGLSSWEAVGMLQVTVATELQEVIDCFEVSGEDDE